MENEIFEPLDDIALYLSQLKTIKDIIHVHIVDANNAQINVDFSNELTALLDCIEMYAARIEAETDKLWEYYRKEKKQNEVDNLEWFRLKVVDDGFAPQICQNDDVVVHRQSEVESGDIAIVTIDDSKNAILRRIRRVDNGMILFADNQIGKRFEPIVIDNAELDRVRIFGKVVSTLRNLQEVKPQ